MSMKKRGILIVVSGFSGAGKGTLMRKLVAEYDEYALSISATTRNPREGEEEGSAYFFKTVEQFEKMIAQGELIEYANYVGNYYGTPRTYVEEQLEQGRDVILEIEMQGALKVKEQFPETLLLFVTPNSIQELEKRLVRRGTETAEIIKSRMEQALREAAVIDRYDYLVINEDLDECVVHVHQIIQSEHSRVSRNTEFIKQIKEELEENVKGA